MIGVTLDSNIYVSALEFHGVGLRILNMARRGIIRVDASEPILDETFGVLRDKFHWEGYRLHFARLEFLKFTNLVDPKQALSVSDDPDDDRILECAIAATSSYIVTHDTDLLRLGRYEGIPIIRSEDFLRRLASEPPKPR